MELKTQRPWVDEFLDGISDACHLFAGILELVILSDVIELHLAKIKSVIKDRLVLKAHAAEFFLKKLRILVEPDLGLLKLSILNLVLHYCRLT